MATCPSCGKDLPAGEFPFCPFCAAALVSPEPAREVRKTVTALFCDVTGSTELGEQTDPEALRELLARYFERMKTIVESHGGTVEKFIGDAVMAVFGVPQVHEDDALRACRAALEMRDALPELRVQARIGLTTGEVVTGTAERLATGDAVNVAARLEQAAQPGEILIGEPTMALVRDAVEAEPVEPLVLKGKAEPVPANRLLGLRAAPARPHRTRFVGRGRELALVHASWERAHAERRCELLTLVGEAGVGKSRLVAEALAGIDCRSVSGRCLPYGEGITYWPLVEVLKQLRSLPSDPGAAASIRSLLGETEQGTTADEIAWAFRKLLREQAPLVVVFDDIQWGEEAFLDLVEATALLGTDAPLLLACMARPELTERRPAWPAPIRLEPLAAGDAEELLPDTLDHDLRERIARAAGGNPLFLTEMAVMAREAEGDVPVPATLRALLAARLDQLEPPERAVLERGAVEGEIFHGGAVQALSVGAQVTPTLAALVRKGLIRPHTAQLPEEDAFRFHHLLLRDAAYDALPKSVRAELHERFAEWLEERGAQLVELDELLGYHLEQAARFEEELGRPDPAVAKRAGERLAAAGRRALWRMEPPAAVRLLERSLSLTRSLRLDVHLELDLAQALLFLGAEERGLDVALATCGRAREAGDAPGEALAGVVAAYMRLFFEVEQDIDALERSALAAIPLLEEAEDHAGLAIVWHALAYGVANARARYEEWARAAERALEHNRLAGGREDAWLYGLPLALVWGPRPADEALVTLEALRRDRPQHMIDFLSAVLLAMLDRFDEAWPTAHAAAERWHELSVGDHWSRTHLADIAALGGDYEQAVGYLRPVCDHFEAQGELAFLGFYSGRLAQILCRLGRHEEAFELASRWCRPVTDVVSQAYWLQIQALHRAAAGDRGGEPELLAREAVHSLERTDNLNHQADAFLALADVLIAAGNRAAAAEALEQALDRFERKRNVPDAARVRERLDTLQAG